MICHNSRLAKTADSIAKTSERQEGGADYTRAPPAGRQGPSGGEMPEDAEKILMTRRLLRILLGAAVALPPLLAGAAAVAQKPGGTLRIYHRDSPANMSIHEEGTISVVAPMMPIFNFSLAERDAAPARPDQ